ncbi:MAG: PHP domain-containing protein [Deltaproteobacteria bacterium]|nr:PHP domain-containing protein [Deltaproteobacteria bacterium]
MNDLTELIEYTGNLHIHSRYSDGAGTVPEIASAAQRLGLDFIIINDHDYMTHDLHLEDEGYYGDVLALMGLEVGKRYHHYLAYDLKEMVKSDDSGPQEVIDRVNSQGGFGFLAHPFEKGMPFAEKSIAYTWNDLSVTGFTGICIWNFSSRWKERVKSPFHAIFFLLFKSRMLKGPNIKTMSLWDDLCRKKRVVAMGGSDAHGAVFKWGAISLTPLTYDYTLNSINVHIFSEARLPKDFAEAKAEIYGALKEGRLFIAHDNLLPAKGFRFHYVSDDGSSLIMGSEKPFQPGRLYIETPLKGKIRLLKNGSVIKQWQGQKASYRVEEKGVYRVEVYCYMVPFGWRAWIFSNPIYLR